MSKPSVIAMVPARIGSERLKYKNLRMLGDKPVIAHAIAAARDSGVFDRVVVNSDQAIFGRVADRHGAEFYQRPIELGTSDVKSDDVVYDFMQNFAADIVVWVNPIAPLQPPAEVRDVVEHFIENRLDSLITVTDHQVHALYDGAPVNFSYEGLFAKTQDLVSVQTFVYSLMMWRCETFIAHYRRDGYALLAGKVGYYPVCKDSCIILKYEDDLRMAEAVLRARDAGGDEPAYDPVVAEIEETAG